MRARGCQPGRAKSSPFLSLVPLSGEWGELARRVFFRTNFPRSLILALLAPNIIFKMDGDGFVLTLGTTKFDGRLRTL